MHPGRMVFRHIALDLGTGAFALDGANHPLWVEHMASKRPCENGGEQQPGVVDEMANAIVRQVKAQRIVTTKGPVYACRWWCLSTAVVGEKRGYILEPRRKSSHKRARPMLTGTLGGRVFFSSPKEAAKALIDTEWVGCDTFMERITIEGTRVVVLSLIIPKDDKWLSPEL
jgi:hypothetical protein